MVAFRYDQKKFCNGFGARKITDADLKTQFGNLTLYSFLVFVHNLCTDKFIDELRYKFIYSNKGEVPIDPAFMFKAILVKRRLNFTTERFASYTLKSDTLIRIFLGMQEDAYDAPSFKTVWKYEEEFRKKEIIENIFKSTLNDFESKLSPECTENDVAIIDSSFHEVPIQRNTPEENKKIKEGLGDALWNDNINKKRHKDIDARFTKKGDKTYYGYKDHYRINGKTKLAVAIETTAASTHDSNVIVQLFSEEDKGKVVCLLADSGYCGSPGLEKLEKDYNIKSLVISRRYKGKDLSDEDKKLNSKISSIRCRIEHAFGTIENEANGNFSWKVGLARARFTNFLTTLTYNICRFIQLIKYYKHYFKDQSYANSFGF